MFTVECEDPNCMGCKQAGEEQSSKEGNQSTMPKTVEESSKEGNQSKIPETTGQSSEEEVHRKLIETREEVIARDLYRANQARFVCLAKCNNLKTRVSYEINELINVLKKREQELLSTIDGDCCAQVQEIDYNSIDKILNKFVETKSSRPETMLVFTSDFNALKISAASFGKLTRPSIRERPKPSKVVTGKQIKEIQQIFEVGNFFASKDGSAAESLIEADAKTTSRAKNAESVSSTPPEIDDAVLEELQIETEKTFKRVNRLSEEVCREMKEMREDIDSRIKLHGIPPADPQPEGVEDVTRELNEAIRLLKERKCRKGLPFFRQHAPKVSEEDSKIIVEEKVSEDPQTMNAEERRRRREMHVLKVRQQREKEMKLDKMLQERFDPEAKLNTWVRKARKDVFPSWSEKLGEDNSSEKDVQCTPLKLTRKDDPETLSGQIEKRMEALAKNAFFAKAVEAHNRVEARRKRRSLEILDLEHDQETKKNDSMDWSDLFTSIADIRQFYMEGGIFKGIDSVFNKGTENNNSLEKDFFKKFQCDIDRCSQESETPSQSSESTDSLSSEEAEKDSSLDEDDIEIISKMETESIPSDLSPSPPLPPKSRFKFGGKPSCFASLLRKKADKKPDQSPRNSAKSKSSGIGESESQKSSLSSAAPSGSNTEVKENPAIQESSRECHDGSMDVDPGNNPTLALRSSLAKYLEKNLESEWLATGKSSEQSKPAENSTKERVVPIFGQELDQWLPAGFNRRKEFAKRRHTDCDWLFNADK